MSNPDPIVVTLNVGLDSYVEGRYLQTGEDEYLERPATVLDLIVERASNELVGMIRGKRSDDGIFARIEQRVNEQIDAALAPQIEQIITRALEGHAFRRTNEWGEPVGKPMTLRERVVELAQAELTQSNRRTGAGTVLDRKLAEVTETALRNELAEPIAQAKAALIGKLNASVAGALSKAITDALR